MLYLFFFVFGPDEQFGTTSGGRARAPARLCGCRCPIYKNIKMKNCDREKRNIFRAANAQKKKKKKNTKLQYAYRM